VYFEVKSIFSKQFRYFLKPCSLPQKTTTGNRKKSNIYYNFSWHLYLHDTLHRRDMEGFLGVMIIGITEDPLRRIF
jgi:hypothetical protein